MVMMIQKKKGRVFISCMMFLAVVLSGLTGCGSDLLDDDDRKIELAGTPGPGTGEVTLSWKNSNNTDCEANIQYYNSDNVEIGWITFSGGRFHPVNSPYKVTDLDSGDSYYFRVQATNSYTKDRFSDKVKVTPP
jgi:hypothetical protein